MKTYPKHLSSNVASCIAHINADNVHFKISRGQMFFWNLVGIGD